MLLRPELVVFDVNETLSDMTPLAARLEDVGAPSHLLATWFAGTLRDGFALTVAGGHADFETVALAALWSILSGLDGLTREPRGAARYVLAGMRELPLHPDVRPGMERLSAAGVRLVALTNGAAQNTQLLLERGGVAEFLELCVSVDEVGRWKPAREAYQHVTERCGVNPNQMMLVAVHPWDIDGAKRAGLAAGWIDRRGAPYPEPMRKPDVTGRDLVALADELLREQ